MLWPLFSGYGVVLGERLFILLTIIHPLYAVRCNWPDLRCFKGNAMVLLLACFDVFVLSGCYAPSLLSWLAFGEYVYVSFVVVTISSYSAAVCYRCVTPAFVTTVATGTMARVWRNCLDPVCLILILEEHFRLLCSDVSVVLPYFIYAVGVICVIARCWPVRALV